MILSRNFVKDYIDLPDELDIKTIGEDMTRVGNEYDEARKFIDCTKLVIGEIIECVEHPDSDHLHVCKVNIGTDVLQIVCGAPNARVGIKVIVALVGAKLPEIEIKAGNIRGVESYGMMCSLAELGLDNKFLKSSESIKDNIKLSNNNINNDVESNLDKSKEESKIENDNNKKENEEEWSKINSNKKEQELIFSNSGKKDFNNQVIEEEEKINRYVDYLNNPPPESSKPSTIPGDAKLNTEYDLFFCGKPNHIDCICCTEHKCKPGACMCISCMKLNKKYHKLKSHYLINKSGRACKYSHGFFHCYCNYTHIVHDVGNNIFKPVYRCQGENICKPCEEITLLMETYLPSTICQKLRDRETRQAQF